MNNNFKEWFSQDEIYHQTDNGVLINGDCLDKMKSIPNNSIDLILCDLPYGKTRLSWDSIIPLDELWEQYKRIIKYNGAIILTAQQPFTSVLLLSNLEMFKYELIWEKTRSPSFAHAKYKPMAIHENILVFSYGSSTYVKNKEKQMNYYPQMEEGEEYTISDKAHGKVAGNATIQNADKFKGKKNEGRYPKSIRKVSNPAKGTVHPTQKPVNLFKWLIKSYTKKNMLILDNTSGSGTTSVASEDLHRKWICIEKEKKYCDINVDRLNAYKNS